MLFEKALSKRSERSSQVELYKSIDDLPQWNWNQAHKTGNYSYLKKLDSYRNIGFDNSEELTRCWNVIYDEFLEEFGLSKRYLDLLGARKSIANLKLQFVKTGNRSVLNEIEIEEIDFSNEFQTSEEARFESIVMAIEKRQSLPIDPKKITVYRYNNYLRTFKEEQNGK